MEVPKPTSIEIAADTLRVDIRSHADLSALATMLTADVHARLSLAHCLVVDVDDVFVTVVASEVLSPTEAGAIACSYLQHLVSTGDYTQQTVDKASQIITRLATYVTVRDGVADVRAITRREVLHFLDAPTLSSDAPEVRTWDNRRWGADTFFRVLRGLNLFEGDPLTDERCDRPAPIACRALTDVEHASCRAHSGRTIDDLIGRVTFALAEAAATTGEIPRVTDADIDLANGRVWLTAVGRGISRWAQLTDWGLRNVELLLQARADAEEYGTPLVYRGRGTGADTRSQSAVCTALKKILRRAGLGSDPTVKPRSIRLWAATTIYNTTGDLEEVRYRLGVTRLDEVRHQLNVPWGRCDLPPDHRRSP